MSLLDVIEIDRFRSLVNSRIGPLGDFTCFAGENNSGKSNILRALSLFLTGEPEPGVPLDFDRDYYADPKSKKKKEISITVWFSLPSYFSFRKDLEDIGETLGDRFGIRKVWSLDRPDPLNFLSKGGSEFEGVDSSITYRFLSLINFRYARNRRVPTDVLEYESGSFAGYFRRYLGGRIRAEEGLLEALREAAAVAVAEANGALAGTGRSLTSLEMTTPETASDLLAWLASSIGVWGLRGRTQTGALVEADAWGSGTQAQAMFFLLKGIDTDYSRWFGWRQATIWAVEEPESSLHKNLEQQLALTFRDWSLNRRNRLQILATTHSEVFLSAAVQGFLVELENGRTEVRSKSIPELVHRAAVTGISGPLHPVLCFPANPVVLLEGSLDRRVLTQVSERRGVAQNCRFMSVPEFDVTEGGGGADVLLRYLKRYGSLTANRPLRAPILVLFDWDVPERKVAQARCYYGEDGDLRVSKMSAAHGDQRLRKVKGIERFYPYELFEIARDEGIEGVAFDGLGNVILSPGKESAHAKSWLANKLCACSDGAWFEHLRKVLMDLQPRINLSPGDQLPLGI